MSNYDNIPGVGYARWSGGGDEPDVDTREAKIDELYFSWGELNIRLDTPDGHLDISVPVRAMDKWNEFVESLPTWDAE